MPLGMSFSAEGYYKTMSNVMEYREGATYLSVDQEGKYTLKGLCNFPVMPSLSYILGF